jgi:hypothetical protein
MDRSCSTHEEKRTAYRVLMGNPKGKRRVGKPKRRWKDNIVTYMTLLGNGSVNAFPRLRSQQWRTSVAG